MKVVSGAICLKGKESSHETEAFCGGTSGRGFSWTTWCSRMPSPKSSEAFAKTADSHVSLSVVWVQRMTVGTDAPAGLSHALVSEPPGFLDHAPSTVAGPQSDAGSLWLSQNDDVAQPERVLRLVEI